MGLNTPYKLQTAVNVVFYVLSPGLLILGGWWLVKPKTDPLLCYEDFAAGRTLTCRPKCEKGYFSLPWMNECVPWLTCQDIESKHFQIKELLGRGAVKAVHRAVWRDYQVVISNLINPSYKEDFLHGLKMSINLQPNPYVTQLLGYCRNTFVTEYHQFGSAENIDTLLNDGDYIQYNSVDTRFQFCKEYVKILSFLHNSPIGTRVMCDSNDLQKTLNQFLITPDFKLVVNDLDALPLVNHSASLKVKCGHRQIHGDFVAPEQLWPFEEDFLDSKMTPYDEKTDIYKVPAVCDYFLGNLQTSEMLRYHLFKLHLKCKSKNPADRPTASQIIQEYSKIWKEFHL